MLVLATISSLPSLPPVFYRDSKDRATNNNSRVLHSPELVDEVLRPAAGSNFDRAGGRDNDKGAGGASALG